MPNDYDETRITQIARLLGYRLLTSSGDLSSWRAVFCPKGNVIVVSHWVDDCVSLSHLRVIHHIRENYGIDIPKSAYELAQEIQQTAGRIIRRRDTDG